VVQTERWERKSSVRAQDLWDVVRNDFGMRLDDEPEGKTIPEVVSKILWARRSGQYDFLKMAEGSATTRQQRNLGAVIDWKLRWLRVRMLIAQAQPDVIVLQELDHMADVQHDMGALGYACSESGKRYTPSHKIMEGMTRNAQVLFAHLESTGVAFIPKTSSNCRKLRLRSYNKGQLLQRSLDSEADDDGVAVFWRKDMFALTSIDFLVFDDKKRHQVGHYTQLALTKPKWT
jgi:hypothetical protein